MSLSDPIWSCLNYKTDKQANQNIRSGNNHMQLSSGSGSKWSYPRRNYFPTNHFPDKHCRLDLKTF